MCCGCRKLKIVSLLTAWATSSTNCPVSRNVVTSSTLLRIRPITLPVSSSTGLPLWPARMRPSTMNSVPSPMTWFGRASTAVRLGTMVAAPKAGYPTTEAATPRLRSGAGLKRANRSGFALVWITARSEP